MGCLRTDLSVQGLAGHIARRDLTHEERFAAEGARQQQEDFGVLEVAEEWWYFVVACSDHEHEHEHDYEHELLVVSGQQAILRRSLKILQSLVIRSVTLVQMQRHSSVESLVTVLEGPLPLTQILGE